MNLLLNSGTMDYRLEANIFQIKILGIQTQSLPVLQKRPDNENLGSANEVRPSADNMGTANL
jgi:hypothetical protein